MYILLTIVVVLILYLTLQNLRKYSTLNQIPGPSWLEVFTILFLKQQKEVIYRHVLPLFQIYGPVFKLWLKPFRPVLLVADPKYFQAVLESKEHVQKTKMYELLQGLAGNGLTTNLDVTQWKQDRKLLNTVFSHKNISSYSGRFKYHAENLKNILESHENEPINTHLIIKRCTFFIILDYLSHEKPSEQTATDFIKAVDGYFDLFADRAYSLYKSNDFLFSFTKDYNKWKMYSDTMHKTVNNIYEAEVKLRKDNIDRVGNKNFMDLILESGLPRDSIISQMKTFIIAGYDTTAVVASFALFEIAKRPDIQENIFNEYLSIERSTDENTISYADLQDFPYTEAVLKETLRIYPAVPVIGRVLSSPLVIDGITIPADTDLLFSIETLHRMNFSNPKEFNPERFLPENLINIPANIYAPFSLGNRNCIGNRIAMIEMKFLILYIVRHFTVHPVNSEDKLDITGGFVMSSKNGVPLIFKRRLSK